MCVFFVSALINIFLGFIGKHKNFELPIMIHIESHEDVLSIVDEFTHWRPIEYPIL